MPRVSPSLLLGLALICACPATPAEETPQSGRAAPAPAPAQAEIGPEFVLAPASGDVAELAKAELTKAEAEGKQLMVYVGASWCEPCQYFHAAVDDGSLDQVFPNLRLLEFDLDQDRERLAAAGYASRMIPLFVVPNPDGLAGPRRTEGGIKGPDAVDHLRARLEPLLEWAP